MKEEYQKCNQNYIDKNKELDDYLLEQKKYL